MKHIYNIYIFLLMFIYQLAMTILGWFLIPLFMLRQEEFTPSHEESRILPNGTRNLRFKDKWFDYIYGNSEDGNCGDKYYFEKYDSLNWWTTYNWCAFRNPIHNLSLAIGVDAYIEQYTWQGYRYTKDTIGYEGFVYSEAVDSEGRIYPMYRWCKLFYKDYGIEMNIGYKNFNIGEVNKDYKYSFTVSVNPFKKFES